MVSEEAIVKINLHGSCYPNKLFPAITMDGCNDYFDSLLEITVDSDLFITCGSIAFLCAWGMRQIQQNCRFDFKGDPEKLRYLDRMNLFPYLEYALLDSYNKHTETGRFITLHTINDSQTCKTAVDSICDLVVHHFQDAREFLPALEWTVNEISDNIIQHSETKIPGSFCAQYKQGNNKLDIGICDMGRGIKESLLRGA